MNEGNDIVWLEAKDTMRVLAIRSSGALSRMCQEGKIQRKVNNCPRHPSSSYRYGVSRSLWDSMNPLLSARKAAAHATAQPIPVLNEDQIQRLVEAIAARMGFVIADELRKTASDIVELEQREPQQEEPKRDLQQIIEEQAGEMARRIGFDSIDQAVKNLQNVGASLEDERSASKVMESFQRRLDQFNEENQTALTMKNVAEDLRLCLAVCTRKAYSHRDIKTLQSVRRYVRLAGVQTSKTPAPAA